MEKKIVRGLVIMAIAVVLSIAMALPAGAGAARVYKMKDFYTSALQGPDASPPDFQWVFCRQMTRIVKPDGSAEETYQCELTEWIPPPDTPPGMGPDLGPIVYPERAVRFVDETGTFGFSDFIFLNSFPDICMADTYREQLTPSGQVTLKMTFPAVDCVADPDDPCCYSP